MPCNPRNGLPKGVYNLIEVISNEPNVYVRNRKIDVVLKASRAVVIR
jgi:hypothetical protein